MSLAGDRYSEERFLQDHSVWILFTVFLSDVCSVFFIFTVITKSTPDIKLYKYMMLKLAICNLLFNVSISMLVGPELLCPLSAIAITSPIGRMSETHAFVTVALTLSIAISVFTSINDCCFIRVCVFYQWSYFLRKVYSWRGILFFLAVNGATVAVLTLALWLASDTSEVFLNLVASKNLTHVLGSYAFREDVIFFSVDIWRPQALPIVLSVVSALALIHIMNLLASRLVWKEIDHRKKNMSLKSFHSHRQLTMFVLSQNLVPIVAVSIPLLIVMFSFVKGYEPDTFAELVKQCVTFIVISYPAFSTVLSVSFIKPYRMFVTSLFCTCFLRRSSSSKVADMPMQKCSTRNCSFDSIGHI